MPPGSEASGRKRLEATGGADRITDLPDGVLERVLSFLPSAEAVRMMLLARRWRSRWKGMRSLRITDADDYCCANELNCFVNMFLLFSNPQQLDVVEINSYPDGGSHEPIRYLELWVLYCLERKVQTLKIHSSLGNDWWKLNLRLLISKNSSENLRVLHLSNAKIKGVPNSLNIRCLDFSGCLVLEDLKMSNCEIKGIMIVSPSLKRLILECCSLDWDDRVQISVPKVVSFMLASCRGRTPILEKMPCLVSAFVRLQADLDWCENYYETGSCNSCTGCDDCIIGSNTSVLLEALSSATHLELTSIRLQFVFRKDLTNCPLFGMLKTLLLNEWCATPSLDPLRCFLQHCPILEKLTIQFPKRHVCSDHILEGLENNGALYNMAKEPISLELLEVEVIRPEDDELGIIISEIQQLLYSFGVPPEKIEINLPPQLPELEEKYEDIDDYNDNYKPWPSARFSFEQPTQLDS